MTPKKGKICYLCSCKQQAAETRPQGVAPSADLRCRAGRSLVLVCGCVGSRLLSLFFIA